MKKYTVNITDKSGTLGTQGQEITEDQFTFLQATAIKMPKANLNNVRYKINDLIFEVFETEVEEPEPDIAGTFNGKSVRRVPFAKDETEQAVPNRETVTDVPEAPSKKLVKYISKTTDHVCEKISDCIIIGVNSDNPEERIGGIVYKMNYNEVILVRSDEYFESVYKLLEE